MSEQLPPHWKTAQAADGKEYYFNEMTGETSWTIPAVEVSPKVAALVADSASIDMGERQGQRSRDGGDTPNASAALNNDLDLRMAGSGPLASLHPHTPKLMIVLVASFVVMLEASIEYSHQEGTGGVLAYAVSVGTVSLWFVLILFVLAKTKPEFVAEMTVRMPRNAKLTLLQAAAGFLFLWWGIGTGTLTFHAPYQSTSNAYFACWFALFSSLIMCVDSFSNLHSAWQKYATAASDMTMQLMLIMLIASLILFLASLDYANSTQGKWGVICGLLTAGLTVIYYYLQSQHRLSLAGRKGMSALLLLLWGFGVGVLTFDFPFRITGNGFFACWTGAIASASFAYQIFFESQLPWRAHLTRSFATSRSHMVSDIQPSRL
jgi:hypothetical protein